MSRAQAASDHEAVEEIARRLVNSENPEHAAGAHFALGYVEYLLHNRFAESARHFETGLASGFFAEHRMSNTGTLGKTYSHLGQYGKARSAFNEVLEMLGAAELDELEEADHRVKVYMRIGESFSEQGRFDAASRNFDKADEIVRQLNLSELAADLEMYRAESLRQAGHYLEAAEFAARAAEQFEALKETADRPQAEALSNDSSACRLVAARSRVAANDLDLANHWLESIQEPLRLSPELAIHQRLAHYELAIAQGDQLAIEDTEAWLTEGPTFQTAGVRAAFALAMGGRQYIASPPSGLEQLHEAIAYYERIGHKSRHDGIRRRFDLAE